MEADWSVQIGAELPVIEVPWPGFVDLRLDPFAAHRLQEISASSLPEEVLLTLNQQSSPVFTSKCDFWRLARDEINSLEFDATEENAKSGTACYIDIIARSKSLFTSFLAHEAWARSAIDEMHRVRLLQAQAELVIRSSTVDEREGFAFTLYVASCGSTADAAYIVFRSALESAAAITMKQAAIAGE